MEKPDDEKPLGRSRRGFGYQNDLQEIGRGGDGGVA